MQNGRPNGIPNRCKMHKKAILKDASCKVVKKKKKTENAAASKKENK